MPVASTVEFESILMHLSVLRYIFKSKSKRGHYDLNKAAETFFRDFLNLAFDYELINLNDITGNHAAIDLGDVGRKLCFQITAEKSSTKIKKTLKKFSEHGLDKQYDRLVMLLLTEKKNYSTTFSTAGLQFDPDTDILDIDDLLERIEKLCLEKKIALAALLKKEMRPLFSQLAEPDSIFKVQPAANMPPKTAKRILDEMNYDAGSGDADKVFENLSRLYSILSNLSRQARTCLYAIIGRGRFKHERFQVTSQEFDNLLSAIPQHERVGNFRSLEDAGLADYDDGMLTVGWKIEPYVEFFSLAKDILEVELKLQGSFERLVVDADFSLLD